MRKNYPDPFGGSLMGGNYKPLNQDQVGRIHQTSLRVLEEVGVVVELDEARDLLKSAGAEEGEDGRVKISPEMVEQALQQAPSRLDLFGREDRHRMIMEGTRTYFGTGGAAINVIDIDTYKPRTSRLMDIVYFARLVNDLNNIDFFVRPCAARDVPAEIMAENEFYASLANTDKHVMGAVYNVESAGRVFRMGEIMAGSEQAMLDRPFFSVIVGWCRSPLVFDREGTRTLLYVVRKGMPVAMSSAPMAGENSPITLAGTLVQLHAEELSGVVLAQVANPGAPVMYGGIPSMADMRQLRYIGGGVEFGLMNAAIAQLSHYINLPNYNSAGVTEAKIPDIQAVYEKCFAVLQCALSGSNCIHHAAGMLESLLTISLEELIVDNEIIGMAKRAVRGIEVDEDRLAFKTIKHASKAGSYLTSDHTLRYLRNEYFEPMLADRKDRETWEKLGMYGARENAHAKAAQMLEVSAKAGIERIPPDMDRHIREEFNILVPEAEEQNKGP